MTDTESSNHRDIVTLREHLESEIGHVKETLRVFKEVLEARLEGMNELRAQIERERGMSLFRPEHDAVHKALEDILSQMRSDIVALQLSRAELQGKASTVTVYWTGLISFLSLLIASMALARQFM